MKIINSKVKMFIEIEKISALLVYIFDNYMFNHINLLSIKMAIINCII